MRYKLIWGNFDGANVRLNTNLAETLRGLLDTWQRHCACIYSAYGHSCCCYCSLLTGTDSLTARLIPEPEFREIIIGINFVIIFVACNNLFTNTAAGRCSS